MLACCGRFLYLLHPDGAEMMKRLRQAVAQTAAPIDVRWKWVSKSHAVGAQGDAGSVARCLEARRKRRTNSK